MAAEETPIRVTFHKLHGLGNDFVLVDHRDGGPAITAAVAAAIADRKRGVGFDQLLVLLPSRPAAAADATLDIYNADGSIAEMCGNGLRAAALYLWIEKARRGESHKPELIIETCAGHRGARALEPITAETTGATIECDMGVPGVLETPAALRAGVRLGSVVEVPVCVDVGNPHAVSFVYPSRSDQGSELEAWGAMIENHEAFPNRANAEFVRVKDKHTIEVKVWERGVGVTEACGTGAVASACAAIHKGLVQSPVKVLFPGGEATVTWTGGGSAAQLRGSAHYVFSGTFRS